MRLELQTGTQTERPHSENWHCLVVCCNDRDPSRTRRGGVSAGHRGMRTCAHAHAPLIALTYRRDSPWPGGYIHSHKSCYLVEAVQLRCKRRRHVREKRSESIVLAAIKPEK
ncbi:unnamed protein product, partial [Iphiclides podalirius]